MDQRRFLVLHLFGVLTTLPEIRILVDCARDQTRDGRDLLSIRAKDMREAGGEGRGGLSRTEMEFTNVVAVVKPESSLYRVDCDALGHPAHVLVESAANKIKIAEDEGLLHIETNGDNIHGIRLGISLCVLDIDLLRMHEFLKAS